MQRTLVVAAGILLAVLAVRAADPKTERLAKLMEAAHKGDTSPLARAEKSLRAETTPWKELKKDAGTFDEVAKELIKVKGDKNRASLAYRDATAELAAAVTAEKKPEAAAALKKLTRTCASCHYGRGTN